MLILYVHGFLSSPLSHKAQQTSNYCQQQTPGVRFSCPALPAYPEQAMSILVNLIEQNLIEQNADQKIGLIGSSLGGYYATCLSERYRLPTVLVNPAVKPYTLMANYLDQDLANYHTDEVSRLSAKDVQQLREIEVDSLQCPDNYWLMVQTGDETLDYTLAVKRYQSCKMTIEEGGDHGFQNFDRWLPDIFSFLSSRFTTGNK